MRTGAVDVGQPLELGEEPLLDRGRRGEPELVAHALVVRLSVADVAVLALEVVDVEPPARDLADPVQDLADRGWRSPTHVKYPVIAQGGGAGGAGGRHHV